MSQTKVAEAEGLSRRNVSDFLRSNALKSLLGEGYTSTIFERKKSKSSLSLVVGDKVGFYASLQKLPRLTSCGKLRNMDDGSTMASIIDKQLVACPDERTASGVDAILSLTGGDAVSYREVYKSASMLSSTAC